MTERLTLRDGALRQLTGALARNSFRQWRSVFTLFFSFLLLLAVYAGVQGTVFGGRAAPVVRLTSSAVAEAELSAQWEAEGISVTESTNVATAEVEITDAGANISIHGSPGPDWRGLVAVLERSGIPAEAISVHDDTGMTESDIFRRSLGAVLLVGFVNIGFMLIAVPLVTARRDGMLRFLGTTPLRRSTMIAALVPLPLVVGVIEAGAITGLASLLGYTQTMAAWGLFFTVLIGLALLCSLAVLCGSRGTHPALLNDICAFIPMILVCTSGAIIPLGLTPRWLDVIFHLLPTTWFSETLSATITGDRPFLPVPVLWLLMLGATVVISVIAVRRFHWHRDAGARLRRRRPVDLTRLRAPRSSFSELMFAHIREFLRSGKTLFIVVFGCASLLVVCALADFIIGSADGAARLLPRALGPALVLGMLSLALSGIAVPLATMRKRGTLVLCGMHPVARSSFVLSMIPFVFLLMVVEITTVVILTSVLGVLDHGGILPVCVTAVLGSAMCLSLGLCGGARSVHPERLGTVAAFVPVLVFCASGILVPFEALPAPVHVIAQVIPTTWFVQALEGNLGGSGGRCRCRRCGC